MTVSFDPFRAPTADQLNCLLLLGPSKTSKHINGEIKSTLVLLLHYVCTLFVRSVNRVVWGTP